MATLKETLLAVRDTKLSKKQVEDYFDELTHLFSSVCLELADLKKKEALYFMSEREKEPDASDVSIKRKWRVKPEGQRMIDLEVYKSVIPRELSSLKNRIYALL